MTDHVEVEEKYDVDEDTPLPDLSGLPGVAAVAPPEEHELEATYVDTPGLALARARITLRRRTGGHDAGWHLKLPADDGRYEVHEPLGDADEPVPDRLSDVLRVVVRDEPLLPVVTVRNRRTAHRLLDERGRVLAEVADDRVTAWTGDTTAPRHWREWEVELVEGDGDLLRGRGRGAWWRPAPPPRPARPSWPGRWGTCARPPPSDPRSTPSTTRGDRRAGTGWPSRWPSWSAVTRSCGATPRTPCTRCGWPRAGCAAPSRRTVRSWTARSPSRSATS